MGELSPIKVKVTDRNTGEILEEFLAWTDPSEWRGIIGSNTGVALARLEDCPQRFRLPFTASEALYRYRKYILEQPDCPKAHQLWPTETMRDSFKRTVSSRDWRGLYGSL